MDIAHFDQYLPHKTFLIQGNDLFADELVASSMVRVPLTHSLSVPRFTSDHARSVAQFLVEGDGEKRVYIVSFPVFSPDAAQVLLKSLEEPDTDTTIILITPHPYLVPQTIRSRTMLISTDKVAGESFTLTRDAALAMIKTEFGSDADDDAATKRARAVRLLDELEIRVKGDVTKAKAVYHAKHLLYKANIPTKFVLEYAVSVVL